MFSNLRDFGVVPFVKAETEEDALLTAQALVAGASHHGTCIPFLRTQPGDPQDCKGDA